MNNKFLLVASIPVGIVISATVALAGNFMSGEAVEVLFKGKTANGTHLKQEYSYKVYFDPNGNLTEVKTGGEQSKGKWRVDGDGNHCARIHGDEEFCWPVRDNGDGSYTKRKRKDTKKGSKEIPVVRFQNFTDGNSLGQ
jgi:hypothetical protein